MFQHRKTRIAALAVAAAVTAGIAGVAVAAEVGGTARAPYAEATALIGGDGKLYQSKGIESVTKVDTGIYCVRLTEPRLNVDTNITAQVTPAAPAPFGTDAYPASGRVPQCNNDLRTLAVVTAHNGQYADQPFYLYVP